MHDAELFGRVALAALLGGIIGWERYARGQSAGDRTFALVAIGAASFTALGVDSFPATAERLIAGIITGSGSSVLVFSSVPRAELYEGSPPPPRSGP